ncbi:MAG: hypothetical protein U0X20_29335 [Caldilineaceae bacterium]
MARNPGSSDGTNQLPSTSQTVDTHGGTFVAGNVATGGGDFVGRDKNIFIGSLPLPRWLALAILCGLVITVAIAGAIGYQFLPATTMPEGSFNIAVAALNTIDASGHSVHSDEGYARAEEIARFIAGQKDTLSEILNKPVEVWGPDRSIPALSGQEAYTRALKLNADTLVFGDLILGQNDRWELVPQFYLADTAVGQGQELLGEYALGNKLTYRPDSTADTGDVNQELNIRIKALVQILRGLSYLTGADSESYRKAAAVFQETADHSAWAQLAHHSGQEILYLFLGNAYLLQAQLTDEAPGERGELLIRGQDAFSQAIALNSAYARPHNGLGSVYFQMARPLEPQDDCDWQWGLLDQAATQFSLALNAAPDQKPPSGQVDLRSYFGLGRVDFWRGFCLDSGAWDAAEANYQRVIDDFNHIANPSPHVTETAALAHTDLGFMALQKSEAYRSSQDATKQAQAAELLDRALGHYRLVFSLLASSGTAEGVQHGIATMPYLLTALCIAGKGEEAEATLDQFVDGMPQSDVTRGRIIERMNVGLWEQCTKRSIS